MRLAVLIHAETVDPESWTQLASWLAERGDVVIAHAHADWSSPDVAGWLPVMRRHGIGLHHQFRARTTQDPALVALTLDALELAESAGLGAIAFVGDVASTLPLLQRLGERGLDVMVAGPPTTPMDVRGACAEFVDLRTLASSGPGTTPGRHRA